MKYNERQAGRPTELMSCHRHGPSSGSSPQIQPHDSRQNGLGPSDSYEEIAQNLRMLRDDDVEMEDASDWPASWDEDDQETQAVQVVDGPAWNTQEQPSRTPKEEENIVYIALDTNIFISHLATVQAIHKQLSQVKRNTTNGSRASSKAVTVKLLVPNVVIHGKYST
jgi:hypothetical protein